MPRASLLSFVKLAAFAATAAFALLLPSAVAQAPATARLPWQHDWKTAADRAAADKKLLLVCVMKNNEIACDRMLAKVYPDPTVALKLSNFILVPASKYTHDLVQIDVDGTSVPSCPQFRGALCSEHQEIEKSVRERFADPETGEMVAPQHIVLTAAGEVVLKRQYEMKAQGFVEFLEQALSISAGGKGDAPAGGAGAAGGPADKGPRSPAIAKLADAILKARGDSDREEATRALLADVSPEREAALLEVIGRLKGSDDQGVVVRTAGRAEYKAWAPTIATLLAERDRHLRNCAVVTLEEEANSAVLGQLLALWSTEKDAEIRKDLLRALGPCGGNKPEAKKVVMEEAVSQKEPHRVAAGLSLGYFLKGNEDVAKLIEARWTKEKSHTVQLALLWGIQFSDDPSQASLIDRLLGDGKDKDFVSIADAVRRRVLAGGEGGPDGAGAGADPGDEPGMGPGPGGGPAGGGGFWRAARLVAPVFAGDKIVRNVIKDFGNRGGGGNR